ncbi:hypothetical protein J8L88_19715 [Aquimarina sp. MMG015]|uniref:hypothetical protein n=1 Tax=Aquimarina TaxID=290174 RepID=UPI00041D78DF|nr:MULTISPECIES: hypothetical protein [Aquimarina]AXT58391.1 hypothetical protein D1815_22465 [Aquimarina sp. AD1]MBQ4805102.1 hypothetical protein [Aquimarina sp. MMG015]RKN24946.1 hypothetical protein D7035_10830 [Aquimarina sp. AD1]
MKSVLLLILLSIQVTYSQNAKPNKEVERLVKLGREHIIESALKEINESEVPKIKKDDFHFITVKASDQRILVEFGYNVLYLPKNTSYYSSIIVELPSKNVSKSSESNGSQNTAFYNPTAEHLRVINLILNPNGKNSDIFHKGTPYSPTIIYEEEKHYKVDFSSRDPYLGGSFSSEEIDKETGEILSTISGHYEPAPIFPEDTIDQEEFTEIKN